MKARIAEIKVVGRDRVTTAKRATVMGDLAAVKKKMKQLAKSQRSVFGAIDADTGRLLAVRRRGRRVSSSALRRAIAKLTRETYGVKTKKARKKKTSKKTSKNRSRKRKRTTRRTSRRAAPRRRRRRASKNRRTTRRRRRTSRR